MGKKRELFYFWFFRNICLLTNGISRHEGQQKQPTYPIKQTLSSHSHTQRCVTSTESPLSILLFFFFFKKEQKLWWCISCGASLSSVSCCYRIYFWVQKTDGFFNLQAKQLSCEERYIWMLGIDLRNVYVALPKIVPMYSMCGHHGVTAQLRWTHLPACSEPPTLVDCLWWEAWSIWPLDTNYDCSFSKASSDLLRHN